MIALLLLVFLGFLALNQTYKTQTFLRTVKARTADTEAWWTAREQDR